MSRPEAVEIPPEITGWCWTIVREPDGRWSLRQRDWRTEQRSAPAQVSDRPLADMGAAIDWARPYVGDIDEWAADDEDEVTDARYQRYRLVMRTARRAA